jgi:hypothetical protein
VIGMTGATFANLETMAKNAGSQSHTTYCGGAVNPCHFYNVGTGDPTAFIAALQQIQNSVLSCQFSVPTSDAGIIDPNKVSVLYSSSGGSPQTIPRVTNSGSCTSGGWFYDNNNAPTTITLCSNTCTVVRSDPNAQVNVKVTCLGS